MKGRNLAGMLVQRCAALESLRKIGSAIFELAKCFSAVKKIVSAISCLGNSVLFKNIRPHVHVVLKWKCVFCFVRRKLPLKY